MAAPEVRECSADLDEGVACRAGYSSFWMTWDGRMLPCGMMPGPEAFPLKEGFTAAWEHIKKETRKIRLPKECAACAKREACAACAAVCVTETGKFDGVPEYMCRMTEEILEQMGRVAAERSKK
jgi:radical SAM protein with 4Fe4S-binding SPASM domain